mgnify:CR=1 FL=1
MEVQELSLPGLLLIRPDVYGDDRGHFMESYHRERLRDYGLDEDFVQDNESLSRQGTVRGLHFQAPPHAQGKLIRVPQGRVWDVALDVRAGSPTYGQWHGVELSGSNFLQLYVPPGMAHGFAVLEPRTLFQYKCSAYYYQAAEGGVRWDDPDLAIEWPIENPIISEKDRQQPFFREFQSPFTYA